MRWTDRCLAAAAVALCIASTAAAAPPDPSPEKAATYGKVDTFEPGKKYNCVPSADRKGWDCGQTGKAAKDDVPPAPRHDEPAPAARILTAPVTRPAPEPAPAASASAPRTGKLPSYLLAPGASERPAPQAPVAASAPVSAPTPVAEPEPTARVVHASATPQVAAPVAAAVPAAHTAAAIPAPVAAIARPEPPAPPAKPAATVRPQAANGSSDFLALPGDQYVIELAHGERETDIAATRASLHLAHGKVYELHLRQNDGNAWLLVWGSFDDVGSARDARAALSADGPTTPGWPRRIAPLQAEVRRTQE